MKSAKFMMLALAAAVFVFSCDNSNEKEPLDIPAEYDGTNFEANTSAELQVREQLAAFVSKAKEGRTPGTTVDAAELSALYSAGSPSLRSITTDYYKGLVDGWIAELSKASGGTYVPGEPAGEGGALGGYLFDENGMELEQLLDKGLYGAAMYNHAVSLIEAGSLTPATVDRLVRIYGAHPDFPNTNNSATAANPDAFLANYTARRDKNDGQGLYAQMKTAFITLQAALKAGEEYSQERDQALQDLTDTWEKANAATVINYCHQAIARLSATNPTEAEIAGGLHSYAEAVGFLQGWRTIPAGYKTISDADIDALLEKMNAPQGQVPTSYRLVTDPGAELPKLQEVIASLQGIYGFTDQEIEDFKENWVSVQGR